MAGVDPSRFRTRGQATRTRSIPACQRSSPLEHPVLIVYLIVAMAVGYGFHALIYKGQRVAAQERLEVCGQQLKASEERQKLANERAAYADEKREELRTKIAELTQQIEAGAPLNQLKAKAAVIAGVLEAVELAYRAAAEVMRGGGDVQLEDHLRSVISKYDP